MRRVFQYGALGVVTALLVGCATGAAFVLFNNTNATVKVYDGTSWCLLQSGTSQKFSGLVSTNITFIVETSTGTWGYNDVGIPAPPALLSFEDNKTVWYLQMQSNGVVYLAGPKPTFPVSKLPEQPHGYPLLPKRVESLKGGKYQFVP
jgi:hypothetical protein